MFEDLIKTLKGLGRVLINRDVRNDHAWMSACTPEAA
jgi:hypothetical protein